MRLVILENRCLVGAPTVQPWARWNLRWNPFGEPPEEDLPGLMVVDAHEMLDWLDRPAHALQLIGESGRGKSAHLHALRGAVPSIPFVYLAEGERKMPPFEGRKLLLDEAQRLPRWRRRRLFRSLDWLALSTHEDLTPDLEATGWSVLTIRVGGPAPTKLQQVLDRRMEWARLGPGPLPRLVPQSVRELQCRHGDDLRSILDELYEATQSAVTGTGPGRGIS